MPTKSHTRNSALSFSSLPKLDKTDNIDERIDQIESEGSDQSNHCLIYFTGKTSVTPMCLKIVFELMEKNL